MTSWADTAVGQATGTIATDFSSANWAGQVSVIISASAWDATFTTGCGFGTQAAGTFRVDCSRMQDGGTAAAAYSRSPKMQIFGDGKVKISSLPTYADDTAAAGGGLTSGYLYKTSAGDLRIKV